MNQQYLTILSSNKSIRISDKNYTAKNLLTCHNESMKNEYIAPFSSIYIPIGSLLYSVYTNITNVIHKVHNTSQDTNIIKQMQNKANKETKSVNDNQSNETM